jgi:hypothetical protein
MREKLRGAFAALLTAAGLCLANPAAIAQQLPPSSVPPSTESLLPEGTAVAPRDGGLIFADEIPAGPRFWASAEYLLWWITNGPNPVPLATTGNAIVDREALGRLGSSTTQVVLGTTDLKYGTFSGGRLTAGLWLDNAQRLGLEGGGFLLEQRSDGNTLSLGPTSTRSLAVPFANLAGQERAFVLSNIGGPGFNPGVGVASLFSSSQCWGAEINGLLNLASGAGWNLTLLVGTSYRQLEETLHFDTFSAPTLMATQTTGPGSSVSTTSDQFDTRNQFYGGQLGIRGDYSFGQFGVRAQAKVGLGCTHQEVTINGQNTYVGAGSAAGDAASFAPTGLFAQPSNIGRHRRDEFTAIPELQLQLNYQPMGWVRLFAGYDAMFWSNVVRPGEQIDRTINTAGGFNQFVRRLQIDNPALGGRPAPLLDTSSVWVHGVSFGVELRY